jgi:hypothetical protein
MEVLYNILFEFGKVSYPEYPEIIRRFINLDTIRKDTEAQIYASKQVGLVVNPEKTNTC